MHYHILYIVLFDCICIFPPDDFKSQISSFIQSRPFIYDWSNYKSYVLSRATSTLIIKDLTLTLFYYWRRTTTNATTTNATTTTIDSVFTGRYVSITVFHMLENDRNITLNDSKTYKVPVRWDVTIHTDIDIKLTDQT